MTEFVHVEAARIPDRDRLLGLLKINGIDARAVDEVGIDVPCDAGNAAQSCDDLLSEVDQR